MANESSLPTEEEFAKREREKVARARFERVNELVQDAGGNRVGEYRFETWQASNAYMQTVKANVQQWAASYPDRLKDREGLILFGGVGTGKDHLVFAAVRQAIIQHDATVTWINGRELFGLVRDRIADEASERSLIHKLEDKQVLVVSDPTPPVGGLTPHQADMLYRIVEARYAAGKLTCMTLNVASNSEADLAMGTPTWDRLCHGAWKVFCKWASYRKPAKEIKP